jgi:hypothetical protein
MIASLLADWKPAYKRGYMIQAHLAIIEGLFGLGGFLSTLDWPWLWEPSSCSQIGLTRSS